MSAEAILANHLGNTTFSVQLQSSPKILEIPPDRSILDVLLSEGIYVAHSCCEGLCGSCLVPVLDGVPEHRDEYLTDEERAEGGQIAVCCSRSRTPFLTLDL